MIGSGLTAESSLAQWLAWQEIAHEKVWDLGLERVGEVWQRLGAPRLAKHIITVAGTNGKGSCVRWVEAICRAHGVTVASFSSPHLLDYCERIRFDEQWVDEQALVRAFVAIDQARGEISLSYFEWSALAAFYLMAQAQPQVVVLEVGLGGRLDATNIIDADAVIITRIGLDHTDWLGSDLETIALEKAGVLRAGQTLVLADDTPPDVLLQYAQNLGVERYWGVAEALQVRVGADSFELSVPNFKAQLPLPKKMFGTHQLGHFAACVAVLAQWLTLNSEALSLVLKQTAHTGRLMPLRAFGQQWLLDVAHNADSAQVLAEYIAVHKKAGQKVHIVCGMLKDKDQQAVFTALKAMADSWCLVSLPTERGDSARRLQQQAMAAGIAQQNLLLCDTVAQAIDTVRQQIDAEDLAVIMGSFVTVSLAMTQLIECN